MASYNKVLLVGNLTRDPELRVTPKGTSVCQFGLATSRQFKDEGGNLREETTFIDIEAWGRPGETISKYCTKGRPLLVEGRLKLDQWEDKATNQKRSKLKVVLESFQFLGSRENNGGSGNSGNGGDNYDGDHAAERNSPPPRAPRNNPPPPQDSIDEDVPF